MCSGPRNDPPARGPRIVPATLIPRCAAPAACGEQSCLLTLRQRYAARAVLMCPFLDDKERAGETCRFQLKQKRRSNATAGAAVRGPARARSSSGDHQHTWSERHLTVLVTMTDRGAIPVPLPPRADELVDLLLQQLAQHPQPDLDRQREKPLPAPPAAAAPPGLAPGAPSRPASPQRPVRCTFTVVPPEIFGWIARHAPTGADGTEGPPSPQVPRAPGQPRPGRPGTGSLLILAAFTGAQRGWLSAESRLYLSLNLVGASVLAFVAAEDGQLGFLLLEFSWAVVADHSLVRLRRQSCTGREP